MQIHWVRIIYYKDYDPCGAECHEAPKALFKKMGGFVYNVSLKIIPLYISPM